MNVLRGFGFSQVLLLVIIVSCGPDALTREEKEKLDSPLQRLLASGGRDVMGLDVSTREGGETEYGVIIRSARPEDLRSAGIRVQSIVGELVTARLTRDEIPTVVRLRSVLSVGAGNRNRTQ
ncbi:MAG TPA: hypothetical protein VMM57_07255 [Bacteroidota bacterium]|nr:hypothetical protein [Bacteroidota bacterium]